MFHYKSEQEFRNSVSFLGDLIPNPINEVHETLINNFFHTGKAKYFRQPNNNLAKTSQGYCFPIKLFWDINFLTSTDFSFVGFLSNIKSTSIHVCCDRTGKIQTVSKNFCKALRIKEINGWLKIVCSLKWSTLFPNISDYLAELKSKSTSVNIFYDVKLNALRDLNFFKMKKPKAADFLSTEEAN
jgi:hypothetical protein